MMEQETPQAAPADTVDLSGESASREAGEPAAAPPNEDLSTRLDSALNQCAQLERKAAELNDLLLRRTAEFDNFRKRTEKEKLDLCEYASEQALKAMLPVLDDFERALRVETADTEYAKGIGLIYNRMFDALKKLGLEPVESLGKPFDPHYHHAIELVPAPDAEDQTVLDELLRGYVFKGRLLRAAMVRVASNS
jgi:molecular chaperone GrpE